MVNLLDVSARLSAMLATGKGHSMAMANGSKPEIGYTVSLRGYELRSAMVPSRQIILAWARTICERSIKPDYPLYWGCWVDNGQYYLDVSANVADQTEALRLAEANGQKAIYDVEADESIRVEDKRVLCDADQE